MFINASSRVVGESIRRPVVPMAGISKESLSLNFNSAAVVRPSAKQTMNSRTNPELEKALERVSFADSVQALANFRICGFAITLRELAMGVPGNP